jgi:hypothetical protein
MGTSSRLVAHLNKWPLLGMPVWPGNGKDGRKLAETGMTALERAGPGTCRSIHLNRSAGFDPMRSFGGQIDRHADP